jgi:predicted phage tail protein
MLVKIKLYGDLASKYGAEHELDAETLYIATQGLISKFGDKLALYIRNNNFRITIDGREVGNEEIHLPLTPNTKLIEIAPVIEGEGAIGRIVFGILLIIFAPYLAPVLAPLGITYGGLVMFGIGSILGGLAMLLTPTPSLGNPADQEGPENKPSFLFNGPVNITEQGGPVPLVYGRVRHCGSVVISGGVNVEEIGY